MKNQKQTELFFPKGFLWGAGTSAYQVEGGIEGNDWAANGRIANAGDAADHYRLFTADFLLAKELGHNAHRFSIEWSRVEPNPGEWDNEALEHYRRVLGFLKRNGIATFVTLHHFTNPLWFSRSGGWEQRESVTRFEKYVEKICQSLGDLIDYWITINEPQVYSLLSYLQGSWPPFRSNPVIAYMVLSNMLAGHNRAYEIIHRYYPQAMAGFAHNVADNEPFRPSAKDRFVCRVLDWLAIDYPYKRTKNDFIGLNHYFHHRVAFDPLRFMRILSPQGEVTDKGWEISPRSISRVLNKLKKYNLPIYITESGLADGQDRLRENYIRGYLFEVWQAIQDQVQVKGYLHWSLLDNFEWPVEKGESGFEMRFGLIEVDFKTQERKIRDSARFFAQVCRSNRLVCHKRTGFN